MIIGLAGAKESGKNTAAKFIAEKFGDDYEVKEWSFAAKLKQSAVAAITGAVVSIEEAIRTCDELKEWGEFRLVGPDLLGHPEIDPEGYVFSGREFLQWYGTEAHRGIFGDDFWIDAVMENIPNPVTQVGNSEQWKTRLDLITDVRFPNEAQSVKDHGGKMFRINRQSVQTGDIHASEKPLPEEAIDFEIANEGSFQQFRENLRLPVELIIKQKTNG